MVLTAILLFGCKKDNNGGSGSMRVKLTDAPGDYKEVNVDIRMVEIHHDGKWMALPTNAGVYDLLKLRDSITTPISDSVVINRGKVTQMRLILGDSNTVVVDSVGTFPLKVPSAYNTGIKINVDTEITVDQHLEIVLDFDAAQSVNKTGNGEYILEPVIKVKSVKTL